MEHEKEQPAFPLGGDLVDKMGELNYSPEGMSIYYYTAVEAMKGMLSSLNGIPSHQNEISHIAKISFKFADELLKQEGE